MENEDPSLSSSESNLPQTIPPLKQHKLGTSATGIWLGGSWDNNNIYVMNPPRAIDNVEMVAPIAHTYRSHAPVMPWDVYPFHLSPILICR